MKLDKSKIFDLLKDISEEEDFLLIDVNFKGKESSPVIEVFVDNEKGVTVKDCEELSRKFEPALEKEFFNDKKYRLDVSSPGIDRPLKYLAQYFKHVGRKLKVKYLSEGEKKIFEGKLLEINGDELLFETKNENVKIKFENIIKAEVLISF